jgi:hypothetical protein
MGEHNHVWRSDSSPAPQKNKDALLRVIRHAGQQGRWLRGLEVEWAKELERDGIVEICCDGKAATVKSTEASLA